MKKFSEAVLAPHKHMSKKASPYHAHSQGLVYTPKGKEEIRPIDTADAGYGGEAVADGQGGEADPGRASKKAVAPMKMQTLVKKTNEGFDSSPADIAKMLVAKHGKNVTKDHIKALEQDRDSHSGLDHDEIMKHVKKLQEETERERLMKLRSFAFKNREKGLGKAMVEEEEINEMDKSQPAAGRDSNTPFPKPKPIKLTDKQSASAKLMTRELLNQAKKQLKKDVKEEVDINELFEMQLIGTDEYRKHAIAMTPGQNQEIENAYAATKSVTAKEDCDCGGECDECNEQDGTGLSGNVRSFSEIRKGIKEAKKEEVIDSTPTLKPKKEKLTSVGPKYYRGDLQGLPVTARFNALEAKDPFMPTPRQVPGPKAGHPVPPGYERVKSWGGGTELRKIPDWKYQKSVIRVGQTGHDEKLKKVLDKKLSVKEAVEYHLENKLSFTENAFRPGSEMFFEMISEAKKLYKEGKYTPADEFELDMLNSDIGEIAEYEGQTVVLDYPIEEGLEECWTGYTQKGMKKKGDKMVPNCVPVNEEDKTDGKGIGKPWREGGGGAVYVRDGGSIRKVSFSKSGMKKRYMDPAATRSFVARHRCLTNKDKTSASYWACRWPRFFSNSGKTWW